MAKWTALFGELPADRRPKLAINEWGLDLPESQQYSILAALYAARLMNVFERRNDLVAMSAVSDLVNGWPGGIIQAGRQGVFVTPIYLVNRLYASRLGVERLKTTVDSPVDAVASRSKDGSADFSEGREHRPRASGDCPDSCQWGGAIVDRGDRASDGRFRDGRQRVRDAGGRAHDARVRSSRTRFFARSAKTFGGGRDTHGGAVTALSREVT